MDIEQVSSAEDFIRFNRGLLEMASSCRKSLERYLSSVLRLVTGYRDEQPTWRLLAVTLAQAFDKEPLNFNRAWLLQTQPPVSFTGAGNTRTDAFDELLELLRFQIADLHRMEQAGALTPPFQDAGIVSPTDHRWFNFKPASFLETAADGLEQDHSHTTCSWRELTTFLWLGQTYHQHVVLPFPAMAMITGTP